MRKALLMSLAVALLATSALAAGSGEESAKVVRASSTAGSRATSTRR